MYISYFRTVFTDIANVEDLIKKFSAHSTVLYLVQVVINLFPVKIFHEKENNK